MPRIKEWKEDYKRKKKTEQTRITNSMEQLVQNLPFHYGTPMFTTVFTRNRHWILSQMYPVHTRFSNNIMNKRKHERRYKEIKSKNIHK